MARFLLALFLVVSAEYEPPFEDGAENMPLFEDSLVVKEMTAAEAELASTHASGDGLKPWIIMYYAGWCDACKQYKPQFEKVAAEMREIVQFGALDCAAHQNVCLRADIHNYPRLGSFNFPPLIENETDWKRDEVHHRMMQHSALNLWIKTRMQGKLALPPDEQEKFDNWKTSISYRPPPPKGEAQFRSLLGSSKMCLGRQVVGFKKLAAMQPCDNEEARKWHWKGMQLVSVEDNKCLEKDTFSTGDIMLRACTTREERHLQQEWYFEAGMLKSNLKHHCLERSRGNSEVWMEECSGGESQQWVFDVAVTAADRINDAKVGFLYSLSQGAFLQAKVRGKQLMLEGDALSELLLWLDLAAKVLPGRRARADVLAFVQEVHGMTMDNGLDKDIFDQVFKAWSFDGLPPEAGNQMSKYMKSCSTYTCGMWSFFHVATLSAAENTELGLSVRDVLARLRGFNKHFFGCGHCAEHFLEIYDSCGYDHCKLDAGDGQGMALWVWQMHNNVTNRVRADKGVSKMSYWPASSECSNCQAADSGDGSPAWDSSAVYAHLAKSYWQKDADVKSRDEL